MSSKQKDASATYSVLNDSTQTILPCHTTCVNRLSDAHIVLNPEPNCETQESFDSEYLFFVVRNKLGSSDPDLFKKFQQVLIDYKSNPLSTFKILHCLSRGHVEIQDMLLDMLSPGQALILGKSMYMQYINRIRLRNFMVKMRRVFLPLKSSCSSKVTNKSTSSRKSREVISAADFVSYNRILKELSSAFATKDSSYHTDDKNSEKSLRSLATKLFKNHVHLQECFLSLLLPYMEQHKMSASQCSMIDEPIDFMCDIEPELIDLCDGGGGLMAQNLFLRQQQKTQNESDISFEFLDLTSSKYPPQTTIGQNSCINTDACTTIESTSNVNASHFGTGVKHCRTIDDSNHNMLLSPTSHGETDDHHVLLTSSHVSETDPYGGEYCPCKCHLLTRSSSESSSVSIADGPTISDNCQATELASVAQGGSSSSSGICIKVIHCIHCSVKFVNGRVYVRDGKFLRPARVSYQHSDTTVASNTGGAGVSQQYKRSLNSFIKK